MSAPPLMIRLLRAVDELDEAAWLAGHAGTTSVPYAWAGDEVAQASTRRARAREELRELITDEVAAVCRALDAVVGPLTAAREAGTGPRTAATDDERGEHPQPGEAVDGPAPEGWPAGAAAAGREPRTYRPGEGS